MACHVRFVNMNAKQMKPRGEGDFDIRGVSSLPSLCWCKIYSNLIWMLQQNQNQEATVSIIV